jgi:hypothetical protein
MSAGARQPIPGVEIDDATLQNFIRSLSVIFIPEKTATRKALGLRVTSVYENVFLRRSTFIADPSMDIYIW